MEPDLSPSLYWDLEGAARAVGRLYVGGGVLVGSVVVADRDRDVAEDELIAAAGLDRSEVVVVSVAGPWPVQRGPA